MSVTTEAAVSTRNVKQRSEIDNIVKRDGRVEKFNKKKIVEAVKRCFLETTDTPEEDAIAIGWEIARAVSNILKGNEDKSITVEYIQRLVIQQLWAGNYFEAAEQYTLYREKQRNKRDEIAISALEQDYISQDAKRFNVPIQYFQFISKYARWNEEQGRRETWEECVDRVMGFFMTRPQLMDKFSHDEWTELRNAIFNLEVMPAMRVLQMAGPALERCNVGAYNCSFLNIDCLQAFVELLYILMQGSGVGFSVEAECIDKLPRIRKQKAEPAHQFTVDDSTEGWCEALKFGLEKWFAGEDVNFDLSKIREQGAILKTKGGRASGPEPLRQLLKFVRDKILARQGGRLTDKDCHDICCMIGKIVQVGGVRRASEISLSDLDSLELRHAKTGNWWETSPWLDMANNSAVYDTKPDAVAFMEEWLSLAQSGSGERGIFNRAGVTKQIPKRRKKARFGMNPCGEIILRSCEFCNLSIVVARPYDTEESLKRKVRLATILGTMQATLTDFKYIRDDWKKNCEDERLLGVDITGQMDCPLLQPAYGTVATLTRDRLLQSLRDETVKVNVDTSIRLGISPSVANTCVKPGGNSAQFLFCNSGGTPWYSDYFLRRVRGSVFDPVSKLMISEGVPYHPDPTNPALVVFEFPVQAPVGAITRNQMTAINMLENWLTWKKHWAEHSVSITVYVDPHEWLAVGNWVYEHWDEVSGLAFLPKSNANYQLAPYEEIDKSTYDKLLIEFPNINWAKLRRFETEDMTTSAQEPACVGGVCELA